MASLCKKTNCKFWIACFTDKTGVQRQRSTRTLNRTQAMKIANLYEKAAKAERGAAKVQASLAEIVKEITGEGLPTATIRQYAKRFLEAKAPRINPNTLRKYQNAVKSFLDFLGDRAEGQINAVTSSEIYAWQTHELGRVRPNTARLNGRLLREMFKTSITERYRDGDPFEGVKPIKGEAAIREGFTVEQVKRLLESSESGEWRSMILFGVYTGIRLSDIGQLRWSHLDTIEGVIKFRPAKTDKDLRIPIAAPLLLHIGTLTVSRDAKAFIHPVCATKRGAQLSAEFTRIMTHAGLREAMTKADRSKGKGRAAQRDRNSLSFHSLRHTYVSLLKNAGAGESVAMALAGHESSAVSSLYTHIDDAAMRSALNRLPNLVDSPAK
jgi:integrase